MLGHKNGASTASYVKDFCPIGCNKLFHNPRATENNEYRYLDFFQQNTHKVSYVKRESFGQNESNLVQGSPNQVCHFSEAKYHA